MANLRAVARTLQRVNEAEMRDRCTIVSTADATYNTSTKTYTAGAETTVYTGKCWVRLADTEERTVQAGETLVTLRRYEGRIPAATTGVQVDDVLTVTESADSELVGRPLRVLDVGHGTYQVDRRLILEDVG